MITREDYFGPWLHHRDVTGNVQANSDKLLSACRCLEDEMVKADIVFPTNPATKTGVAGKTYGGFRPQDCSQGAPHSAHKEGLAVDRWDPLGEIDGWLMKNPEALKRHGIYIEHPSKTDTWSHWSIRAPASGQHVFYP